MLSIVVDEETFKRLNAALDKAHQSALRDALALLQRLDTAKDAAIAVAARRRRRIRTKDEHGPPPPPPDRDPGTY